MNMTTRIKGLFVGVLVGGAAIAASTANAALVTVDVLGGDPPDFASDNTHFHVAEDFFHISTNFIGVSSTAMDVEPGDTLSLTVKGIESGWGFSGTGWAATGTPGDYQITLAPGTNAYNDGFTLTPPADSDVDLTNIQVIASIFRGAIHQTTTQKIFDVLVGAIADKPTLTATANDVDRDTNTVDVQINAALTDTDGSESLQIFLQFDDILSRFEDFLNQGHDNIDFDFDGPLDLSLNNGIFDPLFGRWVLEPEELAGLQINIGNSAALTDTFPGLIILATSIEANPTSNQATNTASTVFNVSINVPPVPEPTSIALWFVAGLAIISRRQLSCSP